MLNVNETKIAVVAKEPLHTPALAGSGQVFRCGHCKRPPSPEGHDGCLGTLPDPKIMNACCGHGRDDMAYIQYWDRSRIEGEEALREQHRLKLMKMEGCYDDQKEGCIPS